VADDDRHHIVVFGRQPANLGGRLLRCSGVERASHDDTDGASERRARVTDRHADTARSDVETDDSPHSRIILAFRSMRTPRAVPDARNAPLISRVALVCRLGILPALLLILAAGIRAQSPEKPGDEQRIADRIRALQQEASRLAAESRSLLGELQKLEVERQLRVAEAEQAEAARTATERAIDDANRRIEMLEQQRQAQLPAVQAQLVDLYKHGRAGNVRLLFEGKNLRDFARTSRAVAALTSVNARRLTEHRQTIESLRGERAELQKTAKDLDARRAEAAAAKTAAERAVAAKSQLATRIDARRDLTAQYVGELQVAYERLQQQLASGSRADQPAVPLVPFRGALDWPLRGPVVARFGQAANRLGGDAVKNGIEIAAAEGAPVRAVHGGTVRLADLYSGFGTLVIVDHGSENYTLYGYLSSTAVARGDTIQAGAEIGRAGASPAGMAALYFEMRIDGRSVDPLQSIPYNG
jgi:murein hydrolase activator